MTITPNSSSPARNTTGRGNHAFAARVAATYHATDPAPRPPAVTPKLTPRPVARSGVTFVRPIQPLTPVIWLLAAFGFASVIALALGLLNFAWNGWDH